MQKLVSLSKFVGVLCVFFGLLYVFQFIWLIIRNSQSVSFSFYIIDLVFALVFFLIGWILYRFLPRKCKSKFNSKPEIELKQNTRYKKLGIRFILSGILGFMVVLIIVFGDLLMHLDSDGAFFGGDRGLYTLIFSFGIAIFCVLTGIALRLSSK